MMPRLPLIGLIALTGLPLIFGIVDPAIAVTGELLTLLIVVIAVLDLVISPSLRKIEFERDCSDVMSVGARNVVRIKLINRNRTTVTIEVHDEPPGPSTISTCRRK